MTTLTEFKNENKSIEEICEIISKINNKEDVEKFFNELLTESEIQDISQRWNILKLLSNNQTQRNVASSLSVSLCNVTRGAKILKKRKFLN